MSTRGNFGIVNPDGTVTGAFIPFDAYPKGMQFLKKYSSRITLNKLFNDIDDNKNDKYTDRNIDPSGAFAHVGEFQDLDSFSSDGGLTNNYSYFFVDEYSKIYDKEDIPSYGWYYYDNHKDRLTPKLFLPIIASKKESSLVNHLRKKTNMTLPEAKFIEELVDKFEESELNDVPDNFRNAVENVALQVVEILAKCRRGSYDCDDSDMNQIRIIHDMLLDMI
jgi:hypothetical protein